MHPPIPANTDRKNKTPDNPMSVITRRIYFQAVKSRTILPREGKPESEYRQRLSCLLRMTSAPITPGIHPANVSRNIISTEPHPLSNTARGGKKMARSTLIKDMSFPLFLMLSDFSKIIKSADTSRKAHNLIIPFIFGDALSAGRKSVHPGQKKASNGLRIIFARTGI